MAIRFLVPLASDAQNLRVSKRFKGFPVRLGRPLIERQGVANRRVLWAHTFPAAWPSLVPPATRQIVFDIDDETGGDTTEITVPMQLLDVFPAGWRYPLPLI